MWFALKRRWGFIGGSLIWPSSLKNFQNSEEHFSWVLKYRQRLSSWCCYVQWTVCRWTPLSSWMLHVSQLSWFHRWRRDVCSCWTIKTLLVTRLIYSRLTVCLSVAFHCCRSYFCLLINTHDTVRTESSSKSDSHVSVTSCVWVWNTTFWCWK